jgi:hypothetical protein
MCGCLSEYLGNSGAADLILIGEIVGIWSFMGNHEKQTTFLYKSGKKSLPTGHLN